MTKHEISASTGGTSNLILDKNPVFANKDYIIISSVSGSYPGFYLTGQWIPLNLDAWTYIAFSLINTPIMDKFMGVLDVNGDATATFVFPLPEPTAAGLPMYFNYMLLSGPGKTPVLGSGNPVYILFTP